MIKPYNLLFLFTLIIGTLIVINSSSWFSMWLGLEINLLSFIPLMNKSKSMLMTEASLKYFLVQALASSIFLMAVILVSMPHYESLYSKMDIFMCISLLMKMGAAPLHFWFPMVCEGLEWFSALILMTWQKVAPFIILSNIFVLNYMNYMFILLSALIGAIGGLNQTSLRKILAYSSINHMGWMIFSLSLSFNYWINYFLTYCLILISLGMVFNFLNFNYLSQLTSEINSKLIKFLIFCSILSLGGLPPFLGFLPKWLILQFSTETNFFLLVILLMCTIVTLNYYIRMTLFSFSLNSKTSSWIKPQFLSMKTNFYMIFLAISSLETITMIFNFL